MRRAGIASAFLAALVLACTLFGACGTATDNREAGRVFDLIITEQDVADYLADYREDSALQSDDDWAQWMADKGTTAEALRKEVVQHLAEVWLVERAAQLRDVTVTDEEVQAALDLQKNRYPSQMAWTRALIQAGYTVDAYSANVRADVLKQKIKDTFADPADVGDDELKAYANNRIMGMSARRSSAIFVSVEDAGSNMAAKALADKAKAALDNGEDFAKVFAEYSSTTYSETGDMGYDYYSTPSISYNEALSALREVNDISPVIKDSGGYFVIVLTDIFTDKYVGQLKLDKFPEELLNEFKQELARDKSQEAYQEFYTKNVSEAQVAVEPMSQGLPYDVPLPHNNAEKGDQQ